MSYYDVAIVGAGPGGLHAANWSAKKGLKVALIEKRKDISKMTRYCSEHIILDEGYNGDTIIVKPGKKANSEGIIEKNSKNNLIPYYTDEEVVYLFSLFDGVTFRGSWSQYESPRMMWDEIHKNDDRIKKERPEIWDKIVKQQSKTLSDSMS